MFWKIVYILIIISLVFKINEVSSKIDSMQTSIDAMERSNTDPNPFFPVLSLQDIQNTIKNLKLTCDTTGYIFDTTNATELNGAFKGIKCEYSSY